jgi:hypothetical protein
MAFGHVALHCNFTGNFAGKKRLSTTCTAGPKARRRQEDWRGNLADQAIGRIEARRVRLLLSKIVIPGK